MAWPLRTCQAGYSIFLRRRGWARSLLLQAYIAPISSPRNLVPPLFLRFGQTARFEPSKAQRHNIFSSNLGPFWLRLDSATGFSPPPAVVLVRHGFSPLSSSLNSDLFSATDTLAKVVARLAIDIKLVMKVVDSELMMKLLRQLLRKRISAEDLRYKLVCMKPDEELKPKEKELDVVEDLIEEDKKLQSLWGTELEIHFKP